MGSKMLVDAAHPEETRVVVVRGNRIEEFDYESAQRKQLKGNIYLAKVTRVEPSLQAAFVDYGGNRHGFLAFSEIHPDYYQIPVADRQALLQEEEDDARRSEEDLDADDPTEASSSADDDQPDSPEADAAEMSDDDADDGKSELDASGNEDENEDGEPRDDQSVDSVGAEDALEEVPQRKKRPRRSYKIQEVIKRRQVILVQVVKEERGNKGAALTTYLSLAGRYCVLMPNTSRGGGISRKITDATDRRRLKDVAKGVDIPQGMGLIVRTAGAQRTKVEIKRDFDYLLRLWENVRDLTLESTAPSLVYEEGSLIKRSIRDLYTKEVDEILIEGEDAQKEAKSFMKMLMPSHARNVKLYKEIRPLFLRYQVESQLDGLFSPTVVLKSGGYMVINQTEALVSIDINSGKSTREHSIEDTALRTNLEAAEEIARQLRLRDLAGLIVIDFIDMEEKRNNRSVERKLKDALKTDRARIQVGRISHFGLLEMSRQRLRQGMLENSTRPCPHCDGTGLVRSLPSCALSVLRSIEEHLLGRTPDNLTVKCDRDVAFYILNDKRDHLLSLETTYGISIYLQPSGDVLPSNCEIERGGDRHKGGRGAQAESVKIDSAFTGKDDGSEVEAKSAETSDEDEEAAPQKRKRRRGRRGGRRSRERQAEASAEATAAEDASSPGSDDDQATAEPAPDAQPEAVSEDVTAESGDSEAAEPKKKPARKRTRKSKAAAKSEDATAENAPADVADAAPETDSPAEAAEPAEQAEPTPDTKPAAKPKRTRKPRKTKAAAAEVAEPEVAEPQSTNGQQEPGKDKSTTNGTGQPEHEATEQADVATGTSSSSTGSEPSRSTWAPPQPTTTESGPRKSGWWSKR